MPSPSPKAAQTPSPDGRRRRGEDNRARIVGAMLELIRSGHVSPGAEQVADQADVGLRTVFRHFNDMDSLYSEMSIAIEAELRAMVGKPFVAQDSRGRVLELIARRAAGFEAITPYQRASEARRHFSTFLQAGHMRFVEGLRELVRNEVPPEIARDPLAFEALDLLLSYETWSRLRNEQRLTPFRAREVLENAVRKLMD